MDPITDAIDQTLNSRSAVTDDDYAVFSPDLDDTTLFNMLVRALQDNVDFWNKPPYSLEATDKRNIEYLLGGTAEPETRIIIDGEEFVNNRLFTSVRAILSYATGQVAQPELSPSSNDETNRRTARGMQLALYDHSVNEDADDKFRISLLNLVHRKRAFLKLRYDPMAGPDGDIVTDVTNPEDIVVDRFAKFGDDPNIIYHRLRCTIDELVSRFPDMQDRIFAHYNIKRGVYTQMSRMITYYEAWFSYIEDNIKKQGVAWFVPDGFILDKIANPNWIYKGNLKNQMKKNVMNCPPKPFIPFNYFNLGRSYIDETCLFDQAVPLQKLINKRIRQITDNADYVNGRWVYNKKAIDEADAKRFTLAKMTNAALGVDADDVSKAIINISSAVLPPYVYQSLLDARNELDTIMGTPSQFRGEAPSSQDTLGRDQMVKQQAGMLQDDLVRAINKAYKKYYTLKLQMMCVYYSEDHVFSKKGGSGDYNFFNINEDTIDRDVKIGVQIDSTLPLDKASIRATSLTLARLNRIDHLTLFEDLGMPDAEIRAERLLRQMLSPLGYMESMATDLDNADAELDIALVRAGKTPDERDQYDESYLNYWNQFLTTNRFTKLKQPEKQRLVIFLQFAQQKAQQMAALQNTQQTTDNAGLLPFQAPPIIPKVDIRGSLSQGDSMQMAHVDPSQNPQVPASDKITQNANGNIASQPLPTNINPQSNNGGL